MWNPALPRSKTPSPPSPTRTALAQFYTYNSQGQLTGESQNGGAQKVTFSYDLGAITMTDAPRRQRLRVLDADEQVSASSTPWATSPRGASTASRSIPAITRTRRRLIDFRSPTTPWAIRWAASIHSASAITATYNSTFDALQSLTDAERQHAREFLQPDQRQPPQHHLSRRQQPAICLRRIGQVTQFINRDGQAIGYTYNSQGLLTSETFPDGSQDTFTYDGHENLVSMTDSTGTTTFAYHPADRLIKVTYPDGDIPPVHLQLGRPAHPDDRPDRLHGQLPVRCAGPARRR